MQKSCSETTNLCAVLERSRDHVVNKQNDFNSKAAYSKRGGKDRVNIQQSQRSEVFKMRTRSWQTVARQMKQCGSRKVGGGPRLKVDHPK